MEQLRSSEGFRQYFPYDSSAAIDQTEVRMTYDDQFIYVAAKMYRSGSQQYVTPSLRRDFRGAGFDVIAVILDTYKDRTNAFSFGVNPFGVQREGLIANGGSRTGGEVAAAEAFLLIGTINGIRQQGFLTDTGLPRWLFLLKRSVTRRV
jgi:hypothetical protein